MGIIANVLVIALCGLLGRLKLSDVIDETYSPDQAPQVYHRLATEKTFPLTQFDWRRLQ